MSPYSMFKYSIRSEITRKYYERRLRRFLDFVQFKPEATNIEERCNDFAEHGKQNTNWALNHIIRFLQYQKERVEKGEIAAGTLRNSVKSLKAFCDSEYPLEESNKRFAEGKTILKRSGPNH